MTVRFPIRAGVAASVLVHLGLVGAVLLFAEVRPFAEVPEQRIEVDVVTADEAPPAPAPPPETKPSLDLPQTKPTEQTKPPAQAAPPPPPKPEAQKSEPKQPEPTKPEPPKKQAAAPTPEPPKPEPPQPMQAAPAPTQPQQPSTPLPPAIAQEPDLTVKYAVALGLPADPTFDAPSEIAADISADAIAALRKRLKSCAPLPAPVTPSDNVKIVLRVALQPDGRLAQEPILIEASASAKGPALMKGAIAALTACQPYSMLPADKYKEWKVLDIDFTPRDFRGG
ncbi:MAG: hypothetical protein HZA66_23505 [Rhodopseudomonas palustris]|uniref:Cell envelope biogenesis protein TolA n=1 Tax=Rhodopseudomonas palustris TaxID=1076 RepID=A0A933S1G4_RHOPL|nr:hypothetical protein [Rhodopseudomonas palustris]